MKQGAFESVIQPTYQHAAASGLDLPTKPQLARTGKRSVPSRISGHPINFLRNSGPAGNRCCSCGSSGCCCCGSTIRLLVVLAKGRESAIRRAQGFTRHAEWFLKLDVRKYFDSVPHANLFAFLDRRFKDRRLLELLHRIITSYRGRLGVGLPIGSLTSQHFYLGWLDRLAKESMLFRWYVRYMGDMVLWHSSRETLVEIHARCEEFAATHLSLDFKPSEVQRTSSGVPFLGCRIFPTHVEFNGRSKRRRRNRVRVLERASDWGCFPKTSCRRD